MVIRSLDPYLTQRGLVQTLPLSSLSDSRLGIDAAHYIRKLLGHENTREVLVAATGGLPIALITQIESDLRVLERLRIKPVFVFPGLPLVRPLPPKGQDFGAQREAGVKNNAWLAYENGDAETAARILTQARQGAWTEYRDVARLVLRIFRHRMVEYIIAPYMQWAQLSYLQSHPKSYIHSVYASMEMLAFPTSRVILNIDFPPAAAGSPSVTTSNSGPLPGGTITFVDKARVVGDMMLSQEQFLDFAIISGSEMSPTFPPMAENFFPPAAMDMIRHFKSGMQAVTYYAEHPVVKGTNYIEQFMRVRAAIKFSLVLTAEEGHCLPLPLCLATTTAGQQVISTADIPSDLENIFSARLPDEIYFHLSKGLVSPQLLGWLSSGQIFEPQPLCNGDSTEYRKFIKDVITEGLTAPRCTALALLTAGLHPAWAQWRISAHYYFDTIHSPAQGSPLAFNGPQTRSLLERCLGWHVSCSYVENELRRQNSSTIDFKLCLGATATDELAKRTKKDKSAKPLDKKDEIVANAIWRFLDLRGLQQPNHTHTTMGRALYSAIQQSRVNDKFQEPLYLALELSRAGVLHGDAWSGRQYSGGPSFGNTDERRSSLLFMRCLSIVPLTCRSQQWSGPLSRELLVFNSFVRSLSRSLRHLFEAVCVHALLRGDARRAREDCVDIALSLPFQLEVNTGFGILAKTYIDATLAIFGASITTESASTPEAIGAKQQALDIVEETFVNVKNPRAEVERGFRFWDSLMHAVKSLAKDQGPQPQIINVVMQANVIEQFMVADEWLKPMRP